jgi:hypothetical protein
MCSVKNLNEQKDVESTKEWINQTLKEMHRKMVELFGVDFTYFRDVKILGQPEIVKQLTQRIRNGLEEDGVVYTDIQWIQICEILSKSQETRFFEYFAFYNPKDEVLYVNGKMMADYPEKIISVCAHELSEKLLSRYLSSYLGAPKQALVKMLVEAKKANNAEKLYDLLDDEYRDTVFLTVFKEGCCEAIGFHTLRNMGYEIEAASMDEDLQSGHSKCIKLLFEIDIGNRSQRGVSKVRTRLHSENSAAPAADEEKLVEEALGGYQKIKGVSYYLGYPLAKAVLEKYGIKGIKFVLEEQPLLEAEYFANPQAYLTRLEKPISVIE